MEDKKTKLETEHIAIARAINLPISTKESREIALFIRNKTTMKAKNLLEQTLKKKIAIPYKRYKRDTAHKPGKIASGRFPQKATKEFIRLINSVESNAENKGLDAKNLVIFDIRANKGENIPHYGRQRGTKSKRTHLTIGVKEK